MFSRPGKDGASFVVPRGGAPNFGKKDTRRLLAIGVRTRMTLHLGDVRRNCKVQPYCHLCETVECLPSKRRNISNRFAELVLSQRGSSIACQESCQWVGKEVGHVCILVSSELRQRTSGGGNYLDSSAERLGCLKSVGGFLKQSRCYIAT